MRVVWIVTITTESGCYDRIVGVYDTEAKAKSKASEYIEFFITQWTVQ
jgi:hypothetical protein